MEKVLFKEEQRFRQWWMWLIVVVACTLPIIIIGEQLATSSGNTESDINVLIIVLCVSIVIECAIVWLLWSSCLTVEIVEKQIRFRFFPLIRKWKQIEKNEIAAYEVRKYKPVSEYGGWGIKYGRRKSGMAYNVSGNVGLQLYLKSGKKLLLGTQKKQAIKHAMGTMLADVELPGIDEAKLAKEGKQLIGRKAKKILFVLLIELILIILIFVLIQVFK